MEPPPPLTNPPPPKESDDPNSDFEDLDNPDIVAPPPSVVASPPPVVASPPPVVASPPPVVAPPHVVPPFKKLSKAKLRQLRSPVFPPPQPPSSQKITAQLTDEDSNSDEFEDAQSSPVVAPLFTTNDGKQHVQKEESSRSLPTSPKTSTPPPEPSLVQEVENEPIRKASPGVVELPVSPAPPLMENESDADSQSKDDKSYDDEQGDDAVHTPDIAQTSVQLIHENDAGLQTPPPEQSLVPIGKASQPSLSVTPVPSKRKKWKKKYPRSLRLLNNKVKQPLFPVIVPSNESPVEPPVENQNVVALKESPNEDFFRDYREYLDNTINKFRASVNETHGKLSTELTSQIVSLHDDVMFALANIQSTLVSELMDARYITQPPDLSLTQITNRCEYKDLTGLDKIHAFLTIQYDLENDPLIRIKCNTGDIWKEIQKKPNQNYFVVTACLYHHQQVENLMYVSILSRTRLIVDGNETLMFCYLIRRSF
jgi:hypothetical protein